MSEHDHQVNLFNWAQLSLGSYPELALMYAIGNQRIGKIPRIKMAAEGVKAGVPDVHLPVAREFKYLHGGGFIGELEFTHSFIGLWIENKVDDNYPEPEQYWWLAELRKQGHLCVVSWDWGLAKDFIMDYLDSKLPEEYLKADLIFLKHYKDGSTVKLK